MRATLLGVPHMDRLNSDRFSVARETISALNCSHDAFYAISGVSEKKQLKTLKKFTFSPL